MTLLTLLACWGGGGAEGPTVEDSAAPTVPEDTGRVDVDCDDTITWDTVGKPVLATWCVECHSSQLGPGERALAPMGVDFDTLEGARAWLDRIQVRALTVGDMPPATTVPEGKRELLARWVACDAPGTEEEPPADPCEAPDLHSGDGVASVFPCGPGGVHVAGDLVLDVDADLSCVCTVDGDVVAAGASVVDLPGLTWVGGALQLGHPRLTHFEAPSLTEAVAVDVQGAVTLVELVLPDLRTTGTVHVASVALSVLELAELVEATSVVVEEAPDLERLVLLRLDTVSGDLVLKNLPVLDQLVGSNSLTWVDGDLRLEGLPSLSTLDEHNNLIHVGGDLVMTRTGVVRMTGFQNIQTLIGSLEVRENGALAEASTMPWLESIGGDLLWTNNHDQVSLAGFGTLSSIDGSLVVSAHPDLERWPAWTRLDTVGADLRVTHNPRLPSAAIDGAVGDVDVAGERVIRGNGL